MKKWVCKVCGYVFTGDNPPAKCPQCGAPASEFTEKTGDKTTFAAEHVLGVAKGCDQWIMDGLKAQFQGECSEVGQYLCMSRVAEREGYPEIAEAYQRYAYEEANHASRFCELVGDPAFVTPSTKKNLEMRIEAEYGAVEAKFAIAKKAKELNLDAIHDTVHEMARDEARHCCGFRGLLARYFGK